MFRCSELVFQAGIQVCCFECLCPLRYLVSVYWRLAVMFVLKHEPAIMLEEDRTSTYTHIYNNTYYIRIHIHIRIFISLSLYIYKHIHTYIYMYLHTYTQAFGHVSSSCCFSLV